MKMSTMIQNGPQDQSKGEEWVIVEGGILSSIDILIVRCQKQTMHASGGKREGQKETTAWQTNGDRQTGERESPI